MRGDADGGREALSAEDMAMELVRNARLLREQAAEIAHYKKMYDRSSALAKIGVWECELATEKLTWTDGVYDLFELPRGSPIDRPTTLLMYDPESRREMERLRVRAISEGTGFSLDIRIRTARGNERWLCLTADIERENGRPVRIFGTKQDITPEKLAEEKVRALQNELIQVSRKSAMGAMASTLAHELNQPLAAISNYVAGTRRALGGPKPAKEVLEQGLAAIEKSAFRASAIIRGLREITKGSGATRQAVDPSPLLREAAALAMTGACEGVALRYDLAEGPLLMADPVQIQQVFINLIKNACEAVADTEVREIAISTALVKGMVEIRVDDTGHGIAPDMLKLLFTSFVSSKPEGMGVGLAVSRTIVEAHGGKISAANRKPQGATFRIILPQA